MKTIKTILLFLVSLFIYTGCYEDKGNYDYDPVNSIEIEPFTLNYSYYFGDTISIKPQLSFALEASEKDLEFEWDVFGYKKFNTRDLFYVADTIVKGGLIVLQVTDTKTGIKYNQYNSISVKAPYEKEGFVILSKGNDNRSVLSYVRQDNNPNGKEPFYVFSDYKNVYEQINKQPMGSGPVKVYQHYHESGSQNGSETGAFWVLQQDESIDVSGVTFEKDVSLRSQFLDGMPAGMEVRDIVDLKWGTFVLDQEGKIYSRKKLTTQLFNSGYFLNIPAVFEENGVEYPVSVGEMVHHRYSYISYNLFYEPNLHRYLYIADRNQRDAGKIEAPEIPAGAYASSNMARIEDLKDYKMIHTGAYKWSSWPDALRYHAILEDSEGAYHSYDFGMGSITFSQTPAPVSTVKQTRLPDATQSTLTSILKSGAKNVFNTGYTDASAFAVKTCLSYVLISKNNELYLLNRASGVITLYDTFDANITAIDTEHYNAWIAGIGLENGKFHVLEISLEAFIGESARRMYSSSTDFGEIVSVRYKGGSSWM